MTLKISTAVRNAECDAAVDLIDTGGGPGYIEIRTGAPPTNVSDPDSGTLLGTCPFGATAFGAAGASNPGEARANAITSDTNADNSGTAGHFRIKKFDATVLMQGTCGLGSGDLSFDNNVIVAGGVIAIASGASFTYTIPIS